MALKLLFYLRSTYLNLSGIFFKYVYNVNIFFMLLFHLVCINDIISFISQNFKSFIHFKIAEKRFGKKCALFVQIQLYKVGDKKTKGKKPKNQTTK